MESGPGNAGRPGRRRLAKIDCDPGPCGAACQNAEPLRTQPDDLRPAACKNGRSVGPMQADRCDLKARKRLRADPEGRLDGGDGTQKAVDRLAGMDQRQQDEL